LVGQQFRGKRPDVSERHRAEPLSDFAADGADDGMDVQEGGPVRSDAAELDRHAVAEVLEPKTNFLDNNVGGFDRTHARHPRLQTTAGFANLRRSYSQSDASEKPFLTCRYPCERSPARIYFGYGAGNGS